MPYNNIISREDVEALIPEDINLRFLNGTTEMSAAMRLFARVPMGRAQQRMPVASAFPVAYFVGGDTGLKQTTEMAWANKFLNVEEIAVIVPFPESVLEDVEFDLEAAVKPKLEEAIGRTLDAAVFFGTGKPASWPDAIVTGAIAAGNTVDIGTSTAAQGGIVQDFNLLFSMIETAGNDVNGIAASRRLRGLLRGARDANGVRLGEAGTNNVDGIPVIYPMRGMWGNATNDVQAIVGDFAQGILGIRRDITYKALTEAVIQDETGAIVYNLAQQDMVAIRVTFRVAWQVSNLLNHDEADEVQRFPFGVLVNA